MHDKLKALALKYSWPATRPDIPFDDHGWFGWCHMAMLDIAIPEDSKLIVEMGSWLGKSTRFILKQASQADVVAIDHWKGGSSIGIDQETEPRMRRLYETFLANCWAYRHRLIPLKSTTIEGIEELRQTGAEPQLIYLDAGHMYEEVKADLGAIGKALPNVRIAGDDYGGSWEGVKRAVDEYANEKGLVTYSVAQAWAFLPVVNEAETKEKLIQAATKRYAEEDERMAKIQFTGNGI